MIRFPGSLVFGDMLRLWFLTILLLLCAAPARGDDLATARQLLLTGKHEEASEAYAKLTRDQPIEAAIGLAKASQSVGKREQAEQLLQTALQTQPRSAALLAELGLLALERGDWEAADKHAHAALAIDKQQLAARWIVAELYVARGQLREAEAAYEWFIDYQTSQAEFTSPEAVYWIGRAAAEYARWKRNSSQFKLLVNDFYPQALELDKHYWPAHWQVALLFLEKYNEADATNALNAALAINPQAAELHATRAALAMQKYDVKTASTAIERALASNPQLVAALQIKADLELADGRAIDAEKTLLRARELQPRDEETLGRLAATYIVLDGWQPEIEQARVNKLIREVVERNPKCGRFHAALADTLDLLRKYPQAAKYYAEAARVMPQLIYVNGRWGLTLMRLGEESAAAKLLTTSFRDDPFNVRVKNMLEVLDLLQTYAVIETEHFIIKFDRGQDELLAKYAAKYLEEQVYPEVVKTLGYAPKDKSLFEIFSRAKNVRGHSWFSTRMVGLPFIGTVGACAGKIVAVTSPSDMPRKFHWGRVLKHEFVHVVNLQQTDFNIPHWFTEGLAVRSEQLPRPISWERILAQRARQQSLFNLDSINLGFIRPANSDEWSLAYCQAELYCDYLVATYGDDALAKLIRAYADNLSTEAALQREFHIEKADFERGYREFVERIAKKAGGQSADAEKQPRTVAQLKLAALQAPTDAAVQAALALAAWDANDSELAKEAALAAQAIEAKQPIAGYVLARIEFKAGDTKTALAILEAVHNADQPHEKIVGLLAALALQANDFAAAERWYRLGEQHFSPRDAWLKALAKVYLTSRQDDKLAVVLAELALLDYDSLTLRKKLAHLAAAKKDWATTERWAMDGLMIDIQDAELHALVGESRVNRQLHAGAIEEYRVAIELKRDQPAWRFALADALVEAGQKDEARVVLQKLIEVAPEFPGAELMLEQLRR
ncbi:MAG TPA: tetratricopeptide repeat protein [Pirellulaceae bacterium]|nr:tetratricopeptide repeat protein [Pirellulaceae bacterium]